MPRDHEPNPHFDPPPNQDQPSRSARHGATLPRHHDPPGSRVSRPLQHHQDQQSQPITSPAQQRTKKPKPQETKRQDKRKPPPGAGLILSGQHDQHDQLSNQRATGRKEGGLGTGPMLPEHHDQLSQPHTPQVGQPPYHGQRRPPQGHEESQPHHHGQHSRQHGLRVPSPHRTTLITWFLAVFCAIFWIVIILGGLIVLIVYLLFRPHNPQFDVSGVTLNAAYLDMDVLLNADITVLANFTNPNRKVKVDFNYVVLDLYYGSTLIASQYVEPFSAARNENKLQDVHLVTSQVRLPAGEIERLKKEVSTNAVVFKIKGVFHARSNLGSLLRYSYRLYGTCVVMVNGPPTGVIRGKRCKTKR